MIRFDEADGTMTDMPEFFGNCAFISQLSDQFYYVLDSTMYQFNGGTAQTATWQSRESVLPRLVNLGVGQALVEGSWSVGLWAYNPTNNSYELKHTENLTTGLRTFRLPSGYEADRYRIKISGTGRFRELRLARTARELSRS